MKLTKLFQIFTSILPYFAVFFASLFHPYDNDLGWYLKYGEYFIKNHQILRENIFSSQMADFKWVNHSWGTDLISYLTFDNFGFLGLSILAAVVVTATFYFFAKASKLDLFEKALIFPALIYFLSPLNSVSFRGQLLSLLFLGILSYILFEQSHVHGTERDVVENYSSNDQKTSRFAHIRSLSRRVNGFYLLPFLFALWSNIHGQFILGLAVFAIWIAATVGADIFDNGFFGKVFQSTRPGLGSGSARLRPCLKLRNLLVVFIVSAFAVLVNPFGFGVYQEAVKHFGNPLEAYISEWVPFKMLSIPWWGQVLAGLGIFFGIIFLFFSEKIKEKLPEISIASVLYLISFSVRRFVWPMYYFSIPLIAPVANFLKPESKKYANIAAGTIFVTYIALTFLIDNPVKRIQNMSWQSYCAINIHCSDGAINHLNSILDPNLLDVLDPEGLRPERAKLLTYYGWGGYIIANYPEIKPSVDGRMTLWRDETGFSAFEEYFAYEQNQNDIDKSPYDVVLMSPQKPLYKRLEKLVNEGKWQKVYEDKFAGVFVKK